MNKKIFQVVFSSIVVTAILTIAIAITICYGTYRSRVSDDLAAELRFLSVVATDNPAELADATVKDRRITLVDSDGTVLFDSDAEAAMMENHLQREEIQEALRYGSGEAERESTTVLSRMMYAALKLDDGRILRIAAPRETIGSFIVDMLTPISFLLLLLLVSGALISVRCAKTIIKPINEIDLEHPEATECYEELSPLLGRIARQQGIIRRQIDDAKQKNREFTIITGNMAEGLVIIDKDARILSVNNAALDLFGAEDCPPGKSVFRISRIEKFSESVFAALAGNRNEIVMESSGRTLQVISSPVHSQDETIGAAIIVIDITEKSERDRLRREFTANVSHELKTPLTSISGFAELLRTGSVPPDGVKEFASDIYRETQRLISLIEDIIKLSRLDEGAVDANGEKVDLRSIASEVMELLEKKAKSQGIGMYLKGDAGICIEGSESLVYEIFYNLAENSIKYNKPDGTVTLEVGRNDDGRSFLRVSDTGIGIPEEDKGRVFERFYRVDKSRSRASGGTGLGLSIVRHAAMVLHADIDLESNLGEGTSVTVTFQ